RILFLASWYPNRTNNVLGMFVKRKAEALSKLCDIAVLFVTMDESLLDKDYEIDVRSENGIFTVRIYFKPVSSGLIRAIFYNIRYVKAHYLGLKTIRKEWGRNDLIHVNVVNRAGFIALLLKKLIGIRYVITEHSTPDIKYLRGENRKTKIPSKFLKKITVKNAEFINVDSTASLEYWKLAHIEGNYGVIQNVVEILPEYSNYNKPLRDNIKRAVHISILIERKNVADIIRAYAYIYYEIGRKNIEFHIIGTGEQKVFLEKLATDLDVLNKCIYFHGYLEEKKKIELLVNSDFHIINSDEEGFSVVTAEAILYGIPVIATRCGGPEDFVPKEVGILIDRRNLKELTYAIIYMIDHSQNYDKNILREFGRNHFSEEVISRKTYDVYNKYITKWKAGNTASNIKVLPGWIVLDVGSGHQPNRRANVILEKYLTETIHRTTQKVIIPNDKYIVVADAHFIPFKDKSFDYVIASHIGEHVDDPIKFCQELQRVSKRGYIETPGPLTEFMMPTKSHKWVVKKSGNKLIFKENTNSRPFSMIFFRVFYLNREGYVVNTLYSNNFFLRLINISLIKIWKYLPGTYTIIKWQNEFKSELVFK
ncbi:MAG: glycosyltransferase, partial [Ignavibacteriaceae bacterium]|nr:glycosyltransferase [Ignavibacteriaceae bacterium]